jgi:hypothetical protein
MAGRYPGFSDLRQRPSFTLLNGQSTGDFCGVDRALLSGRFCFQRRTVRLVAGARLERASFCFCRSPTISVIQEPKSICGQALR